MIEKANRDVRMDQKYSFLNLFFKSTSALFNFALLSKKQKKDEIALSSSYIQLNDLIRKISFDTYLYYFRFGIIP